MRIIGVALQEVATGNDTCYFLEDNVTKEDERKWGEKIAKGIHSGEQDQLAASPVTLQVTV